jgi:hypothetical protein
MKRGPVQHRVCGGIFTLDPDVPPDQNGRRVCRCGLVGEPGDTHHALPDAPQDARSLAAGEHHDRGDRPWE